MNGINDMIDNTGVLSKQNIRQHFVEQLDRDDLY